VNRIKNLFKWAGIEKVISELKNCAFRLVKIHNIAGDVTRVQWEHTCRLWKVKREHIIYMKDFIVNYIFNKYIYICYN